jgi:hypothetical protein
MAPSRLCHLVASLCFLTAAACSGSNDPSVASGNTAAGSSKDNAAASAGKAAEANAGKSSSNGGSSAGRTATGGAGGSSTSSSTSMMSNGNFSPLCSDTPPTAAGAPTKGGACTASDPQLCYKTCGPQSVGFKSETCTNGSYAEQTGCSFPDVDYSCFKIPTTVDSSCPSTPPQATMPCDVATCVPCNSGGNYLDSSGASKAGYCVCPMAGDMGARKWSCASTTAWPCPLGKGC